MSLFAGAAATADGERAACDGADSIADTSSGAKSRRSVRRHKQKHNSECMENNMEKYTFDAAQLTKEIAAHEEDISVWTTLEKEEMNAKQASEMLMLDLKAQIDQAKSEVEIKTETKAKKLQAKAAAEGDVTDTTTARDEDQKYLTDLNVVSGQRATEFESRQRLRIEELEAASRAFKIASSVAVDGSADKHLPSLSQIESSSPFNHLR